MSYKQVIVVRKDLKMGKGKIAAQVAHAALGAIKNSDKKAVESWEEEGSKKVVLKVDGIKDLIDLSKKAREKRIPYYIVRDAGLTQIKEGTITCMGIGPDEESEIDEITKGLKLL